MNGKSSLLLAIASSVGCTTLMSHPALPASGGFVTQLGVDTVAIERYTRSADRLEGDVVVRSPRIRVMHYVATLDANGRMTSLHTTARIPSAPANAPARLDQTITFGATTTVETLRNGQRDTASSGVKTYQGVGVGTIPTEPPSYGLYEQIISANTPPITGSAAMTQIGGPGPQTAPLALSWRGPDSVQFSSNFFPGTPWLEIAAVQNGKIVGVNSMGTTIKTIAHRDDNVDYAKVLTGFQSANVICP